MSKSRSFERAANYYDSTRRMLEPIENYGIPAIQEQIGAESRVLEVGAGTGRISIPLLERGMDLVACDLSSAMLARFQEKHSSARMVKAEASHLPFAGEHFDAVLTVHVLHLIPGWRDVLREFKRVLVPGGVFLNVRTWDSVEVSAADRIREFWRGWMREHGVDAGHPGVRTHDELKQELHALGATLSEVEPVRYKENVNLHTELEHFANRVYSETWDIPDAVYEPSMIALRDWAEREYGDLDQDFTDEVRVVIHVARF